MTDLPFVDNLHDVFDRVHDGAKIVDPSQCAFAVFVTNDGAGSRITPADFVTALRDLADQVEARL